MKKLAELAKIEVSEKEQEELLGDLKSIIGYVDQIKQATIEEAEVVEPVLKNVFREDNPPAGGPHEPELYTKRLMKEAPREQDGYVKVKKIL